MSATKVDFINDAYSRARISGLTKLPSPSDVTLALTRLEDMAALWESKNICTGYNFEDIPDPNSPHNVDRAYWTAFKSNLAMMILADFGKIPMPSLIVEASGSLSALYAATAQIKSVPYPNRQPVGSGNLLRGMANRQMFATEATAPTSCATQQLLVDDVNDYLEHFDSFLQLAETIVSYTIESRNTDVLTVSNDANTDQDVSYRGTAVAAGISIVRVQITTSLGRIKTNNIYFEIFGAPDA